MAPEEVELSLGDAGEYDFPPEACAEKPYGGQKSWPGKGDRPPIFVVRVRARRQAWRLKRTASSRRIFP